MTKPGAISLLGSMTVGSTLLSFSLFGQVKHDLVELRWRADPKPSPSAIIRQRAEPLDRAGEWFVSPSPSPADVRNHRPASRSSPFSSRAHSQITVSERALAARLADWPDESGPRQTGGWQRLNSVAPLPELPPQPLINPPSKEPRADGQGVAGTALAPSISANPLDAFDVETFAAPSPAEIAPIGTTASIATIPVIAPPPADLTSNGTERLPQADTSPGRQAFPALEGGTQFTYDDELILQIKVSGIRATDTIVAYGTRDAVYLPFGELSRILDLAIRVSDDGHYASGWFLSEDRTLTIDLRQGLLTTREGTRELPPHYAQAFDGELYLRAEAFAVLLPLEAKPDLRAQAILLTTLEPFPFEERLRREENRAGLHPLGAMPEREHWPREETPWLALSVPIVDVEMRAVSDSAKGSRAEGELRIAGDLAYMTAQAYFSGSTRDGLTASLLSLGRRDADGDLLGPLRATEFQLGDIASTAMTTGLRGKSGRGLFITNEPFETGSVFDQIDLRGVLPDGYEVELYRNDILLGSTREAVNGQYEFLQIPVDYGLNVMRLVFYGPQGQRREEVRRISVGDGRLSAGQWQYSFGALQKEVNLFGVNGPDFRPVDGYGNWQASGELAYGITSGLTAVAGAAVFEESETNINSPGRSRFGWIATTGLRTGFAGLALRADAGLSDGGGYAAGLGVGGAALGGAFTVSHFEYGGNFIDEVRSIGSQPLRRATEMNFNTSLNIGGRIEGIFLPITARLRHNEFVDGRTQSTAALRGSARIPGMIVSNTLDYSRATSPGGPTFSQLVGNFDLATFNRSTTQFRASVGYRVLPKVEIAQLSGEGNHRLDDETTVRGSAAYAFASDDFAVGLSAIREFGRFTLALDGQYGFRQKIYSAALRLGFSFGRDPLQQRFFVEQPGRSSSGAIALHAFQDMDGDLRYSQGDKPLPAVDFAVFGKTASTDENGFVRLDELGNGNRVSVQVDPSTFPDILMAPASQGIEIVPRAGRFHVSDFPIFALSEVEGTVTFGQDTTGRGVSGLNLQMLNQSGEIEDVVRTERGGYYFFERVKPGTHRLIVDPEQARRLGICLAPHEPLLVGPAGGIYSIDLQASDCGETAQPAVETRP